jgi:hypothetical protein
VQAQQPPDQRDADPISLADRVRSRTGQRYFVKCNRLGRRTKTQIQIQIQIQIHDQRGAQLVQDPDRFAQSIPIQRRLHQGALGRFVGGFECNQLLLQLGSAEQLCVTLV